MNSRGGAPVSARRLMARKPSNSCEASSMAALSVCEALALALAEEGVLPPEGVCVAIDDAVAAHREAARQASNPAAHTQAAALAEAIRKSVEAAVEGKRRN